MRSASAAKGHAQGEAEDFEEEAPTDAQEQADTDVDKTSMREIAAGEEVDMEDDSERDEADEDADETDEEQEVASAKENLKSMGWTQIPGRVTQVSVGKGKYWAVTKYQKMYFCEVPCKTWKQVPGRAIGITAGDNEVAVWDKNGNLYKTTVDAAVASVGKDSPWKRVLGVSGVTDASIGKEGYWALNKNQHVFYCSFPCSAFSWKQVNGKGVSISASNNALLLAYPSTGTVWQRTVDSTSWKRVSGASKVIEVAFGKDHYWAVRGDNKMYYCALPCTGAWTNVPGRANSISVGDDEVLVVWNERPYRQKISEATR